MIRLSLNEVQKVLRLASNRGMISPTAGPTVNTVADAFGLQPWQVEKLLTEVREIEAEAPQWRSLRLIGVGVGVVALLGLTFSLWPSGSQASTAPSEVSGGPGALAPGGGPLSPQNYVGAQFNGRQPAVSASSSSGGVYPTDFGALQRRDHRRMVADTLAEQAVLPKEHYVKTEDSDLNNAKNKADRSGRGGPDYDIGGTPRPRSNVAAPSAR